MDFLLHTNDVHPLCISTIWVVMVIYSNRCMDIVAVGYEVRRGEMGKYVGQVNQESVLIWTLKKKDVCTALIGRNG